MVRKHSFIRIIPFLLFLFCSGSTHAQLEPLHRLLQQGNEVQEKVFVHTDKTFYVAGEIIWFQVYVTTRSLVPSKISKVGYVEVLDEKGKPLLQAKIGLKEGIGSGSFRLPSSLPSGNMQLRSYTAWMKNQGPEEFFTKNLTIVNTLKSPVWKDTAAKATYDIRFFPEGGQWVTGLESTLGCKVLDADGKGVSCSGSIINSKKDTLQRFTTLWYGMGRFRCTAQDSLKAVIRIGNQVVVQPLPVPQTSGYAVQLADAGDSITLRVQSNISGESTWYLAAHTREQSVLTLQEKVINQQAAFHLAKKTLPPGITVLTVFNEQLQAVGERLYFTKPPDDFSISLQTDRQVYSLRDSVQLQLSAEKEHQPARGTFSLSVFLLDELQQPDPLSIRSYLWLSSELKGTVEGADDYFSATADSAASATENLLLTQGWRRIMAPYPAAPVKHAFLPEWEGPLITAHRLQRNGSPVMETIPSYLSVPGTDFRFASGTPDSTGRLYFITRNFYGRNSVVLQSGQNLPAYFELENPFSTAALQLPMPVFKLSTAAAPSLNRRSISMQAQNSFLADQLENFAIADAVDSTPFYGIPDKKYLLDEYTRFTTMEEVLREYVAEVRLRKGSDGFHLQVRNQADLKYYESDPLILLDGVPVFDADGIVGFDPLKIRKIEVVARKYHYGGTAWPGIISFSSYGGDLAGFNLPEGALQQAYDGLQLQRSFYTPVYNTTAARDSRLPDFRNQLKWMPGINTAADGKKSIRLYTSDLPGRYAVVVQGITAQGQAAKAVQFFEVRQ